MTNKHKKYAVWLGSTIYAIGLLAFIIEFVVFVIMEDKYSFFQEISSFIGQPIWTKRFFNLYVYLYPPFYFGIVRKWENDYLGRD